MDEFGCEWTLTRLSGWLDGATPTGTFLQRPGIDGSLPGPATHASRPVTIEGVVWSPDPAARLAAMDRVGSLLSGAVRRGLLVVDEKVRGLSRQAAVQLGGTTVTEPVGRQGAAWSVQLVAPDPVRYGSELHEVSSGRYAAGSLMTIPLTIPLVFGPPGTSGFMTALNRGISEAWPVVRFTGPLTNPTIRIVGGPQLTLLMDLAAGDEVVVDTNARTVLQGSASRRNRLSFDSAWWSLPPGESALYVSADAGSGSVAVEWRDAW